MAIDIRKVSKTYGAYTALRDVSLRVDDGELIALLGPSGSGKTTLLRILAGLDVPDRNLESAVILNGDKTRVGFVFQHYALFKHMTVFENVAFGLRVRSRKLRPAEPQLRSKVNELLALIQLERWAGHYPSQLSGGQRQRVALARALAIEPGVLLLDEPFGALDARVRQELRTWLRNLHEKISVTSVLVTHDQEEALEVADRIVIMNQGRIEQIGTPDEVFHRPASEFVVRFLGNVNLFHGRTELAHRLPKLGGENSMAYVRPHDLDIARQSEPGTEAAQIQRIQSAGSLVRVELASAQGDPILVELTHTRHRELGLKAGESVYVKVRESQAFVADYQI
jgi:sulfate transport system ATP-binding protein